MKKRMIALLTVLCLLLPVFAHAEANEEPDWYLTTADALRGKLHELITAEGFAEFFTSNEEVAAMIASWGRLMNTAPASVRGYDLPAMEIICGLVPEMQNLPDVLLERIERSLGTTLITQLNSSMGVNFLAACSMASLAEGYVMPENFTPCIVVYEYEGVCVCVSFTQIGEGVVSAAAQFAAPEITELLSMPFEE